MKHLSTLVFDEAAAGEPIDPEATAHLEECADCRSKLSELKAANAKLLASPYANATRNKIIGRHFVRAPIQKWLVPVIGAMAAAVLIFVLIPRDLPSTDRIKGAEDISVLRDGEPIKTASPGQRVSLRVARKNLPHVAVFAQTDDFQVDTLWPLNAQATAQGTPDAQFEVTPGSVWIYAVFTKDPVQLETLKNKLRGAGLPASTEIEVWTRRRLEVR